MDRLTDEAGVCEREGAVLKVTCEVDARLKRGRLGRTAVSVDEAVASWNWRR